VEEMLQTQDQSAKPALAKEPGFAALDNGNHGILGRPAGDFSMPNPDLTPGGEAGQQRWYLPGNSPQNAGEEIPFDPTMSSGNLGSLDPNFSWEMISLGLDEPLPPQETVDELHDIYFNMIHPSMPMIHKFRYLAAMNLAPNQRPPVCLRYAMWTLAASVSDKYTNMKDHFYQRARKYVERDYLKGHGEHMISVAHAQTHIILCSYEFKMMYFPRAWMSTGSAVRLCQMMGLHRLDGAGLDVKRCLPPPRDWTEREERRRTFWMAFCEDRYASIGTGWPMTIDERDIHTNLPSSEEAFEKGKPERTQTLEHVFQEKGAVAFSPFGGVCLMAALFGRNLVHLHRPDIDDRDNDLEGEFWKRHRHMDSILLNTSLSLPSSFRLPAGLSSANIVFTNMNIHTSTICLHQAAIYKSDKNSIGGSVSKESKLRCISAANEITNIMRMVSHMDLGAVRSMPAMYQTYANFAQLNPFISFCLYVAARVYVQYLKSRPDDNTIGDSLRFLLAAMNVMKITNPLTESFLVQLDVDLESLGLSDPKYKVVLNGLADKCQTESAIFKNLNRNHHLDGKIDQCNFLKMIDNSGIDENNESPTSGVNVLNPSVGFASNDVNGPITTSPEETYLRYGESMNWIPQGSVAQSADAMGQIGQRVLAAYGLELDVSSAEAGTSDRPTPNSSVPSDGRSQMGTGLLPGKGSDHPNSGHSSFDTSPSTGLHSQNPNVETSRTFYHTNQTEYVSTGMTPGQNFALPIGMTMGPSHTWEMNQGGQPIGDGIFRELMGLAPMDVDWEG
jgi:hypothetical protein